MFVCGHYVVVVCVIWCATQVQVDMEFAQGMFELHRKVKQSDVILEW